MIKIKNKALTQNASPFPKYPSRTPIREVNTRFHPCGEAQCSAWGVGHQLCGALADQVDVQLAHLTKFTVVVDSTKLVIMLITTLKRGDFFSKITSCLSTSALKSTSWGSTKSDSLGATNKGTGFAV